jgi:nicotinamidase-related amidase
LLLATADLQFKDVRTHKFVAVAVDGLRAITIYNLSMTSIEERGPSPTRTALLIVDAQVGLVELMPAEVQRSVVPRIGTLIDKARASGVLVIYIQHDGPKGHPLETHTQSWEICPLLKPADGEQVIRKRESDSFFETLLQRELEKRGIAHLIIAGGMTEYCVDTTCRRAASVGYDVTLAGDAHFTRDNEVLTAKNIIAHHNFVLDGFGAGDHLVRVKPADEIVF